MHQKAVFPSSRLTLSHLPPELIHLILEYYSSSPRGLLRFAGISRDVRTASLSSPIWCCFDLKSLSPAFKKNSPEDPSPSGRSKIYLDYVHQRLDKFYKLRRDCHFFDQCGELIMDSTFILISILFGSIYQRHPVHNLLIAGYVILILTANQKEYEESLNLILLYWSLSLFLWFCVPATEDLLTSLLSQSDAPAKPVNSAVVLLFVFLLLLVITRASKLLSSGHDSVPVPLMKGSLLTFVLPTLITLPALMLLLMHLVSSISSPYTNPREICLFYLIPFVARWVKYLLR